MEYVFEISQVLTAPVADAVRRAVRAAMRVPASEVTCPHCGRALAALMHRSRRLHGLSGGVLGPALGTGHRDRVTIACDHCKTPWTISGSGVWKAIRDGRHPLV